MIKRLFDLIASMIGLVLISPLFLLLIVLVWLKMGSPVFFTQDRPGKSGKPFKMIKFRTMTNEQNEDGNLLPDNQRITKLGTFMRKNSLDELPELINVLKGDMSLVGPRPLLMRYLEVYTDEEMKRHDVRPGITGLSQINGRNNLNWNDRLRLDLEYVGKQTFFLDFKILVKTVINVIRRKDIVVTPNITMKDLDEERRN